MASSPPLIAVRWRGEWRAVLAAEGPERIADAWWRLLLEEETDASAAAVPGRPGDARHGDDAESLVPIREYWRVAVPPGVWLWIFREACEAARGRWFLHGIWA